MPVAPVAGFTPFQQQAFNQIQGLQGGTQHYFDLGQQYLENAARPISAAEVNNYYNPYAANVFSNLHDVFGQQQRDITGKLTQAAGGVGADRIALGQANLAKQQGLAAGQVAAQLYQPALQAAQQEKQMNLATGYGLSQLGPASLQAQLLGTSALTNAGALQQAQQQAELNAPYQNTLARIAYPFQTAQYLSGITGGLAPAFGGTQSTTATYTPPTPSTASQILGTGLGIAGLAGGMATGNPMMAAGGLKGATSGSGLSTGGLGGTYNPFQFTGSLYKRGGATKAEGGPVNPYDFGEHFAFGGYTNDPTWGYPSGAIADAPSPYDPTTGTFAPIAAGSPPLMPATAVPFFSGNGTIVPPGQVALAQPGVDLSAKSASPDYGPIPYLGPENPANRFMEPFSAATMHPPIPSPATNPERIVRNAVNPAPIMPQQMQQKLPYPDATTPNWGSRLASSPWLSLVSAGAKIAQTPGPIGSAIGAGMQAGVNELQSQRKASQSEESINQRAMALYEKAKEHLDRYTKMTPYEAASASARREALAQGRYQKANYYDANHQLHAGKFNTKTGQITDFAGNPVEGATFATTGAGTVRPLTMGQAINAIKDMPEFVGATPEQLTAAARRMVESYGGASTEPQVGEIKQFKQGTGVWNGTEWVPANQ